MAAEFDQSKPIWRSRLRENCHGIAKALKSCSAAVAQGALLGLAVLAIGHPSAIGSGRLLTGSAIAETPGDTRIADDLGRGITELEAANLSAQTRYLAGWVMRSRDNGGAPFVIVDKKDARLYLFDTRARLVASTAVLLGSAVGDVSIAGIGDRPIALVRPEERTTPAGRFVAERGRNARGEDVVWVDYDAAVSIHRVITENPAERRLERLASQAVSDKRISYGCINVPVAFYEAYVRPAFATRSAIVYVLPESKTIHQVFGV